MADELKSSTRRSEMDLVVDRMSELTVLSFRKIDEVKRLARHLSNVINHPLTQECETLHNYMSNLDKMHRNIFCKKREGVEVEYIFTTEKKSGLQRQRFNSLPVSEIPELLKTELLTYEDAKQVHICTDCNVEIEMNDEVPLIESLQKHFNLEVHLPKMKRESVDVAEPIILPNMSRRLSSMECGETPAQSLEQFAQLLKPTEKIDRSLIAKLEVMLIRHLPDNSEAGIDAAVKFYQSTYDKLCQEISAVDFSTMTSSVAPIIMSIKDNVNQNFAADANKNFEQEENEVNVEKPGKNQNQVKKYRCYGPIENMIIKLLTNHKLLSLVDDRTGKLAFFCMSCEYYTLRFRYDSVLNHVLSETHIHNLACILQADKHIPFPSDDRTIEKIKEINRSFFVSQGFVEDKSGLMCKLCKVTVDSGEATVVHLLDENHLANLSDKLFRKAKSNDQDATADDLGQKSLDWVKYLASNGKPLNNRDHVVLENFIKTSGKIANYCSCCDMTLKGPRQVLFNHIRQKKHLRNAAPHKLSLLYKNHCRPAEYYASFGNFYICALCPDYVSVPCFAAIVEHFESDQHMETVAKLIRSALYLEQNMEQEFFTANKITTNEEIKCNFCDISFQDMCDAVSHVLSSIQHQNLVIEEKSKLNKGDIISVYMQGNYILHSAGATFSCEGCKGVFNSIRSLLSHLVYADHFKQKPTTENVFRFYLELKHNIVMLARNKYIYYEFGKLKCGVCEYDLEEGENAKRHVVAPRHRENMGTSLVNVNLDTSVVE